MNQTPAAVDRRVIEQPLQRPLPAPLEAFIDFPRLLGDVNMNWTIPGEGQDCVKFV